MSRKGSHERRSRSFYAAGAARRAAEAAYKQNLHLQGKPDERQSRSSYAAGATRRAAEAAYHQNVHLQGNQTSGEAAPLMRPERPFHYQEGETSGEAARLLRIYRISMLRIQ